MDELIDILDQNGMPTGDIRLKSEAHQLGMYHSSVHIWFFTDTKKVLVQKRAANKDTYPDLWDISVAGHIATGEIPRESAIREIKEEIGLSVSHSELEYIGVYSSQKEPKPGFLDNEFNHVFIAKLTVSLEALTPQQEEVADITLMPINEFTDSLNNAEKSKLYVPHAKEYYDWILKEITNRL